MKKVSIIIPVYNTIELVGKALASASSQTYSNVEIIVVDDASTDGSGHVAEACAQLDDRITVIHHRENAGLSASRNTGLLHVTGEYVYFLDSDDYLDGDCIATCVEISEKYGLDILTFDAQAEMMMGLPDTFVPADYNRSDIITPYELLTGQEFVEKYQETDGLLMPTWLLFLRRKFIEDKRLSFLEGAYFEDNKFHFDCMLEAERVCYVPRTFYHRVYRPNSIMTSIWDDYKINSMFDIAIGIVKQLVAKKEPDERFWLQYVENRVRICIVQVLRQVLDKDDWENAGRYHLIVCRLRELIENLFSLLQKYQVRIDDEEFIFLYELVLRVGNTFRYRLRELDDLVENIRNYQRWVIYTTISGLNLLNDSDTTVGIYGTGAYANYILEIYLKCGGKLNAKLFFIESSGTSYEKMFRGRPVINIADTHQENPDAILVASTKYDVQMIDRTKRTLDVPVYSVYSILGSAMNVLGSEEDTEWIEKIYALPNRPPEKPRLVILNTPVHRNIGDYLIIWNMERLFQEHFSEYEVVKFTFDEVTQETDCVFDMLRLNDIIIIGGGGFLGSMWSSGRAMTMILYRCRKNRIIIFPQSVYFTEDEEIDVWLERYAWRIGQCRDLTICTREVLSYHRAQNLWSDMAPVRLMPDVALMMPAQSRDFERQGILICLRKDKESVISDEQKKLILNKLYDGFANVRHTSMHYDRKLFGVDSKVIIDRKLDELSFAEVVITDALHCMISCALTGTPCIALDNLTGKVGGVYEWIKELEYIQFVKTFEELMAFDVAGWDVLGKQWKYTLNFDSYVEELRNLIAE